MARIIVNVDLNRGENFDSQLSEIKSQLQSLGSSMPDYSKHAEQVRNLGEAYNTAAVNLKKWSESIQTVENRALNVSERMSAQSQAVKELGNSYSTATSQISKWNGEMREVERGSEPVATERFTAQAQAIRKLGDSYSATTVQLSAFNGEMRNANGGGYDHVETERYTAQAQAVRDLGEAYSAARVQLSAFNGEMRGQNTANQQNAEYARILAERHQQQASAMANLSTAYSQTSSEMEQYVMQQRQAAQYAQEHADRLNILNVRQAQQAAAVRETASSYSSYTSAWNSAKHANNEQQTNILSLRKSYAEFINQIVAVKDKYPKGTFDEMEQQARANSKALQGMSAAGKTVVSSNNQLVTSLDEAKTRFSEMREEVGKNADALRSHNQSLSSMIQGFARWQLVAKIVMVPLQLIRKGLQDINETMYETEDAVIAIRRVMSDAPSNTAITNELYNLAAQYGQDFENVSDIVTTFARSGKNWQESIEATRAALVALNVAELDTDKATEGLIALMSQFKIGASDLQLIIDKINITADRFPVTSERIIDALSRVGSSAYNANISIDQTIGLITALSEATGRQGSAIGTALNSLIQLTKKGLDSFEGLSDEMANTVKMYRLGAASIYDVWKQLSTEIKNLNGEQSELLDELFSSDEGQEWLQETESELGTVSDTIGEVYGIASTYRQNWFVALLNNFDTAEEAIRNLADAAGYSAKEQEAYNETMTAQTKQLKAQWDLFAASIGENVWRPILEELIELGKFGVAVLQTLISGAAGLVLMFERIWAYLTFDYDKVAEIDAKFNALAISLENAWNMAAGITDETKETDDNTKSAADAAGDLASGYDAANAAAENLEATAEQIAEDNKAIADAIKDANSERKSANSLAKSAASVAKAQQSYEEAIVKARLKYQKSVLDGFKDALKQEDEYQKKLDQIQDKRDKVEEKNAKVKEKELIVDEKREEVAKREVELAESRLELEQAIKEAKQDYLVEWLDDYFNTEDLLTDLADKQLTIAEAQADVEEAKREALEAEAEASEANAESSAENLKNAEKELRVQQALADLAKAESQRNVRVYDANGNWSWQADASAVQSAQDKYDSALAALVDSDSGSSSSFSSSQKKSDSAQKKVSDAEKKVEKAQEALDDWLKGTTAKELKEFIKENGLDTEGIHDIIAKWLSYGSTDLQTWGKDLETSINTQIAEQAYDDEDIKTEIGNVTKAEENVKTAIENVETAEENVKAAVDEVGKAEDDIKTAIGNLDTWLQEQAIADLKTKLEESNGNLSEQDIKDTLSAWLGKSVSQDAGLVQWGNALTSTFGAAIRSGYYDKSEVQSQLQSLSSAQASYADTLVDQMWSDVEDLYRDGKEEIAEDTLEAILNGYRAMGVSEEEIDALKETISSSASSGSIYSNSKSSANSRTSTETNRRNAYNAVTAINNNGRNGGVVFGTNSNHLSLIDPIIEDPFGFLGVKDFFEEVWNNTGARASEIVDALSERGKELNRTYDSGGILNGLGGIKATVADEAVLDPNLTRKLLNPSSNAAFSKFASSLGILFGVADKIAKPAFSSSGGTTNNYANKSYNVNGVPIPQNAATQYSLAELCSMMTLNAN